MLIFAIRTSGNGVALLPKVTADTSVAAPSAMTLSSSDIDLATNLTTSSSASWTKAERPGD